MVVDMVTTLMWEEPTSTGTYDWAGAKRHCVDLRTAGYSDWRLPTRIELVSLVDFTRSDPAIDTATFPSTVSGAYWTSSPFVGSSSLAWNVYFTSGYPGNGDVAYAFRVRCVR